MIDEIKKAVMDTYKITEDQMMDKNKTRKFVLPRQIAMYISRLLTMHSTTEIGSYFGNRDHRTVIYAFKKIASKRKDDPHFDRGISELINSIKIMDTI